MERKFSPEQTTCLHHFIKINLSKVIRRQSLGDDVIKNQKILYYRSATCHISLESKFSREQKTCLGHIMKIKLSKVIKHLSLCNRIIKIPKNFDIFKVNKVYFVK